MTLSEELTWRGFTNQTTYKDISVLDDTASPVTFYLGVDPSADSMTIGNLAVAMMVRHFIDYGHKAILLVGGATGLIGDPDGKKEERDMKTSEEVERNKQAIARQYDTVFAGQEFEVVDNYNWFKDMGYLQFLREIGKHVPMRQMLGREFVQSRLGEEGAGISYAEFSYALMQGYDFLHLFRTKGVILQLCGADQWGNSIAGVDIIRRIEGGEAHVWSAPLVVNKTTGVKFGKSEDGAIWLDPAKTTPTAFYQFWINADDLGVESYLKIFTLLDNEAIDALMARHQSEPHKRIAQTRLAIEVTKLVHGQAQMAIAQDVTDVLKGANVGVIDEESMVALRTEIASTVADADGSILAALTETGLASSISEARRLLQGNAIALNGAKVARENFESQDFKNGRLLIRRGKAYKDSALVELA
jgi:tyrosyl-tRNA synthetase